MRVVLFASALLVAAGQALSLTPSVYPTQEHSMPALLAQTDSEQMPGGMGSMPNQADLKKKAAIALDKDDKKKMGSEAHSMFHKVKKVLTGKNDKSRDMAAMIEDVMSGKAIPGVDKPKKVEAQEKKEEVLPKSEEAVDNAKDNTKFKDSISEIQTKLEAKNKDREKDAKNKLQKVVNSLKEKMENMKASMKKKSELEQKAAVQKYQIAQKKVNLKIFNTMKTQLPKSMRGVAQNATLAFRKGKVSKQQIGKLLNKHFSDDVFQNILRCIQGDLEYCRRLNMQKWQESATKDINVLGKKARAEGEKEDAKKKQQAIEKINQIIAKKSQETHAERKATDMINAQAHKLTEKIQNDRNLNWHQKQETIQEVKDQVRNALAELHGKKHETKRTLPPPEPQSVKTDKANISDNDIALVKQILPEQGLALQGIVKPGSVPPPAPVPAPVAVITAPVAAPIVAAQIGVEEATPTGLAQLVEVALTAPVAAPAAPATPAPAAALATAAAAVAPAAAANAVPGASGVPQAAAAAQAPTTAVLAVDAAAEPVEDPSKKSIPQKPREARVLEKEIKDNEIKLRLLKPRALELLEADEATKAANAKTQPRSGAELNSVEEDRIKKEKANLTHLITKDQERLQEIFPDSTKAAYKEYKSTEAQQALAVISQMGDKLSKDDAKALAKIVREAEHVNKDEKEGTEKEIAKEVAKQSDAAASSEKVTLALAKQQKLDAEEKLDDEKSKATRMAKRNTIAPRSPGESHGEMALEMASNKAGTIAVDATKLQPHLEPRGMFKMLSPDISFVADGAMEKKVNTTTSSTVTTQMYIQRPHTISKAALAIRNQGRFEYKVPEQSEDYQPPTNSVRSRTAIQLHQKEQATGKKGSAVDQVKVSPPSDQSQNAKPASFSQISQPSTQRTMTASSALQDSAHK